MRLAYAIKFVADMDAATAFHRDTLGLPLKFLSPFWSEFSTGESTLALHPASDRNPAGSVQLGYQSGDLDQLYAERALSRIAFTQPPVSQHGTRIARFTGSEGEECSLGEG
jgi:catechol 2,3-dioxygenase-like lactoylglutathione lyase family enzyme